MSLSRNALEFGDAATVARVGALEAQGSAEIATYGRAYGQASEIFSDVRFF